MFNKEEGIVLPVIIIIILVLVILGTGVAALVINATNQNVSQENRVQALYIAEGGLDFVLNEFIDFLNANPDLIKRPKRANEQFWEAHQALEDDYLNRLEKGSGGDSSKLSSVGDIKIEINAEYNDSSIVECEATAEVGKEEVTLRRGSEIDFPAWLINPVTVPRKTDENPTPFNRDPDYTEVKGGKVVNLAPGQFPELSNPDKWKKRAKKAGRYTEFKKQKVYDTGYNTDWPSGVLHYLNPSYTVNYANIYNEYGDSYHEKNKSHKYPTIIFIDGSLRICGKRGLHLNNHYIIATGNIYIQSQDRGLEKMMCPKWCKREGGDEPHDSDHMYNKSDGVSENSFIYSHKKIVIEDPGEEPENNNHNFHNYGIMMAKQGITYKNETAEKGRLEGKIKNTLAYQPIDTDVLSMVGQVGSLGEYVTSWEIVK